MQKNSSIQTPVKLLFVCVENSNRSQMSEAFARILGKEKVDAYSAGSKPSGVVNAKAIKAMSELNYDLTTHYSKSVNDLKNIAPFDYVITMGCGDSCGWMPAKHFLDWNITDPKNLEPEQFNEVRDEIKNRITDFLKSINILS